MDASARRCRILEEAWIGDAVLCLYARRRILKTDGAVDGAKLTRMTSNQFLAVFGEPSEVEAEIGRIYAAEGLDAACEWIETRLMPLFDKHEARQEAKRKPTRYRPAGPL